MKWYFVTKEMFKDKVKDKVEEEEFEFKCSRCGEEKEELWAAVPNAEESERVYAIDPSGFWECDECLGCHGRRIKVDRSGLPAIITPGWLEDLEAFEKAIRPLRADRQGKG